MCNGFTIGTYFSRYILNFHLESKIERRTDSDHLNIVFNSYGEHESFQLKFFARYVDDTLAVFSNAEEATRFLNYLNSIHTSLKFTMEGEIFDRLPFLDLLFIRDNLTDKTEITVYRKPTHSGVFTHFTSFIPHHFKVGLVKTLLSRAYRICSNWNLFHIEIERIKSMLKMNGYTTQLIESQIKVFLDKKYSNAEPQDQYGPDKFSVFIRLPFIGESSAKIRASINSCLSKIKCGRVQLKYIDTFSRIKDIFKYKDRQPKRLLSNIVYLLTCSCGRKYVGETCRNFFVRYNEHVETTGSNLTEFGKHLQANPGCHLHFDTDNVKVLCFESNTYRRKLKESLFIQQLDDGNLINNRMTSQPLYLFNLRTLNEQSKSRSYQNY